MMLEEFIQHKGTLSTEKNKGVVWGRGPGICKAIYQQEAFKFKSCLGYTYIELALG